MQIRGTDSNKRNDYTSTYDQYKQGTIENVTLAEDLIIRDLFEDIPDVKFFYRSNLPAIDDIESEPSEFFNGASTANYIRLTVPNNVIWSTICPIIEEFYVYNRGDWVMKDDDPSKNEPDICPETEYEHHTHVNKGKFYFNGLMKFYLAEEDDEDNYDKFHMIILPGEEHTGVYKIVKGTVFLAEMLGGNNRVDKARIVAISASQHTKVENAGIAIEIEDEEDRGVKRGSGAVRSKGTSGKKATKYTSKYSLFSSKAINLRTDRMRDRLN
ncbi:MAG: hypothetical protein IKR19_08995 [Acholeplasmatales bacterium]|nr:hypothetical protein [Acholeplasmatales bacterium]